MTFVDLLSLASLGLFSAWTFITLGRSRLAVLFGLALLAALALAQVVVEGPYLHLIPAYSLALLCAVIGFSDIARRNWLTAATARVLILAMAGATGLAWVFLPVPLLTTPTGPYEVGTQIYRWIDASRDEPTNDDPTERRNVIAQAWYPAETTNGANAPYLDGLGRLPPVISPLPSFLMVHYDRIATAPMAVRVSQAREKWPVILFSPGYGAARGVYTSLLRDLASRGYVVIALDHPFESAVSELADGRIATPIERFFPSDPDRRDYMVRRLDTRIGDVRFLLDQLENDASMGALSGHLDTSRIVAIGHSFGGSTAIAIMALDRRISAAVDIDGALYGAAVGAKVRGPVMVIDSDPAVTGQDAAYFASTNEVLANAGKGSKRIELVGTHHYSFTDALLLLSPPARWAAGQAFGATRDANDAIASTVDELVAFLGAAS